MIMEEEKTAALYKLFWFRNRPRRCGVCMKDRTALGPESIFVCWSCDGSVVGVRLLLAPWCDEPGCSCMD